MAREVHSSGYYCVTTTTSTVGSGVPRISVSTCSDTPASAHALYSALRRSLCTATGVSM